MTCQKKNIFKKILDVSAFLCIPVHSSFKSAMLYATVAPHVKRSVMQGWSDNSSFNFVAFCECHNISVVCCIIWCLPYLCMYVVLV